MAALYDSYLSSSPQHSNKFSQAEFDKVAEGYERQYGAVIPEDRSIRVLDIGCGQGHFLYFLSQKGYQCFEGIDTSHEQVHFCRKHVSENVFCFDVADFLTEERRQASYDLVVMNEVLEHLSKETIIPTLKLVYRSLREGGRLIVKVPNMENPFNLHARYHDFTHEVGFTPNSLMMVLRASRFEEVKIYSADHFSPRHKGIKGKIRSLMGRWARKVILRGLYLLFEIPDQPGGGMAPKIQHSKRIFAVADK